MNFYPNQLFHIYNQGNNRQPVFFTEEHYKFFLWKMRAYLLPFGDLIAYCLMPNHFHWQFFVREIEIERKVLRISVDAVEMQRRREKYGSAALQVDFKSRRQAEEDSLVSLNEAIGILQKAYARAINQEKNWTGSLFRKECKAKDGWIDEFITLFKPNGKLDARFLSGTDYAYNCFCYIHNNPNDADLVKECTAWKYSSAQDYAGLRKGNLCNLELGRVLLNL